MRFLLSQEFSTVVQRLEHPTVYGEGMGSSPIGTAKHVAMGEKFMLSLSK